LESAPDVERVLESIKDEAKFKPERPSQLMSIQYYLRDVISKCERAWVEFTRGYTNYKPLLDEVSGCPEVCFATFNYDTMLERALLDVRFPTIESYVAHPRFKVIKLHGSVDWHWWVPNFRRISGISISLR
jgi:hypothetical protein